MRFFASTTLCTIAVFGVTAESQALTIDVKLGAGVTPEVAAAVTLGVRQWERALADPIAVEIEVATGSFQNSAILATTSAVFLQADYATIRQALVAESPELLPVLPEQPVQAMLPPGFAVSSALEATKANLKALGLSGLDEDFGSSDGSITLSDSAAFDLDPRDGVTPGRIDLQGLVAHEIAHVLGFVSSVDWIDMAMGTPSGPRTVDATPLDLFRFPADANGADPSALAAVPRNLTPGSEAAFEEWESKLRPMLG